MDEYMEAFNKELVGVRRVRRRPGLAAPVHTRRVRLQDGVPVVTDGPYAETQEVLAGYTIVECDELRPGHRDRRPAGRLPEPRPRARYVDVRPIVGSRRGAATDHAGTVEDLLRRLAPQVLGALVRRYGHFDTAEDAVQEALLAAAAQWPAEGVPDNPRGWLITVASARG